MSLLSSSNSAANNTPALVAAVPAAHTGAIAERTADSPHFNPTADNTNGGSLPYSGTADESNPRTSSQYTSADMVPADGARTIGTKYTAYSIDNSHGHLDKQNNTKLPITTRLKNFLLLPFQDFQSNDWRVRRYARYKVMKIVPCCLGGLLGYAIYVYCYLFAYRHMIVEDGGSRRRKGIALIAVFLFLATAIISHCIFINLTGPGYVPRGWGKLTVDNTESLVIDNEQHSPVGVHHAQLSPATGDITQSPNERTLVDLEKPSRHTAHSAPGTQPDAFICGSDGYRVWCNRCDGFKPDRSHHSNELDRCILKMDHYCPYVGSIIGFRNYKLFYHFSLACAALTVFTFVTLTTYIVIYGIERHHVTAQFIIIDAICAVFAPALVFFCATHTAYILRNQTTIEYGKVPCQRQRWIYHNHLSIAMDNGRRETVGVSSGDPLWNLGPWQNWKDVMGTYVWEWVVPWNTTKFDGFSFPYDSKFLDKLRKEAVEKHELTTETGAIEFWGSSRQQYQV
ncbi:DHHC palmitoyltransferase-domain-containing protein [Limtongia smithiae]|uniref:DHHC palmitoyltransferase-domain-containing protein n=1 Tax=Limtongia smithiae TaxID=1125753 RepID=UPI0034CD9C6D